MEAAASRRRFLLGAAGVLLAHAPGSARSARKEEGPPLSPAAPPHDPVIIRGSPVERGRQYGKKLARPIRDFLVREIYAPFCKGATQRRAALRYAGACARSLARYSPEIMDELHGMAAASGLRVEELILLSLHEELWHRGALPPSPHCTVAAFGPPESMDGSTYVGQTWDWMPSVHGLSTVVHWKRDSGPDVLAYGYPGLWVGAGVNAAGVALCWTSAGPAVAGPSVGIPSYLLVTHLLYQPSLDAALEEARRATRAGWFAIVMADAGGRLASIEGSPAELAVEIHRGHLARSGYGTRQMTRAQSRPAPEYETCSSPGRCRKMYELLERAGGGLTATAVKEWLTNPELGIFQPRRTLDILLFDANRRALELSRGLGEAGRFTTYALPRT